MNIIIISYYYSPGNLMGAIRASKLSKYFKQLNANVSVIASYDNKWLFLDSNVKIDETLVRDTVGIPLIRISHSKTYQFLAFIIRKSSSKFIGSHSKTTSKHGEINHSNVKKSINIFIKSLMKFVMFFASLIQDFDFMFKFMFCSKQKLNLDSADVIISSYGPYASHFVGFYIKLMKGKKVKWIADFRDPIAQPTDLWIQRMINKYFEILFSKKADFIVAVSDGYLDQIVGENYNDKKKVITNGFDKDDIKGIVKSKPQNKLTFCYTGTTYNGRRDLTPLFTVIRELINDGLVNKDFINFTYAGPEANFIKSISEQFDLNSIFTVYSQLPRIESIKLNNDAEVLVVATWDDLNHTGVLPGKLFELMLYDKPIIALVNGELTNSELSKLINSCNLGFCFENAKKEDDIALLKQYVLNQYEYFILNNDVIFSPEKTLVSNYDYSNIACEYLKLINRVCSN